MRWLLGIGAVAVAVLAVLLFSELRSDGDDDQGAEAAPSNSKGKRSIGGGGEFEGSVEAPRPRPMPPRLPPGPRPPRTAAGDAPGSGPAPALPAAPSGPVLDPTRPHEERVAQVQDLWFARDYENAMAGAIELLDENPRNAPALWVAVASACMLGDSEHAQTYFDRVRVRNNPERDNLAQRCRDAGVELVESPQPAN